MADARSLMDSYGDEAYGEACRRVANARDDDTSSRSWRHWAAVRNTIGTLERIY